MKIPYPGDLNPIETAVWAAEYVRSRAERALMNGPACSDDIAGAIEEANYAVADLRHAREHLL